MKEELRVLLKYCIVSRKFSDVLKKESMKKCVLLGIKALLKRETSFINRKINSDLKCIIVMVLVLFFEIDFTPERICFFSMDVSKYSSIMRI